MEAIERERLTTMVRDYGVSQVLDALAEIRESGIDGGSYTTVVRRHDAKHLRLCAAECRKDVTQIKAEG
jgi:hypothetical protein